MPQPPLSDELCAEAIALVQQHGSVTAAATAAGIPRPTMNGRYLAALRRQNPMLVTGRSTLRNAAGELVMEWEKTAVDVQAAAEARQAALEVMLEDLPRAAPIRKPELTEPELCNLYTFSDYHLGMLAWHREGGADWDVKIAERMLIDSLAAMIRQSPPAHSCVLNIQGDFLHTDGKIPLTPMHKHVLDADSRYPKIRKIAIRSIRQLVQMALDRHEAVHLVIAEGNHDEEGSGWLNDLFDVHYEDEPRVTVNDSALPFYVFQWGDTMLGIHHGHKVKNEQLPGLFSAQFRPMWGATTKAYIHCGHRHHVDEKEYNGAIVIQHPTIAARDAYAARGGWIAERAVQAITYHKRFGQVGRVFVSPEMLGG